MGYGPSPAFLSWAAEHKACFPKLLFFGTKKTWVETTLAQLARAGSWQGAHCESLGKEELCISLTTFLCCEGTQRKFFISAKIYSPEKRPLSSGSSPSHPPPLPSRPETSECHFHAVRPTSGTAEPPPLLRDPSCCGACPSGWDAAPRTKLRLRARALFLHGGLSNQAC